MRWLRIFFGETPAIKRNEFGEVIRESIPGLAFVLGTALLVYGLTHMSKFGWPAVPLLHYVDSLVLAVIMGMLVRLLVVRANWINALTPGILVAPPILIPAGIILYGMKFRLDAMVKVSGSVIITVLLTMLVSALLIYFLSVHVFHLSKKLAQLLGIGSAVCGATAIAVASPVVQAEPDEMGTALVTNTLLALFSLFVLKAIMQLVAPEMWAAAAGALLPQTGFVKLAVQGDLQAYALLIKTLRVSLLLVIVPLAYFLNRGKVYLPWYMFLFIGVGVWCSYGAPGKQVVSVMETVNDLVFPAALVGIGMNADIRTVFKKVWKPLLITALVFCLGMGLFLLSSH